MEKNFDVKLGDMGYDLYIPYAQSCELMDVIEKGIRAMEYDMNTMQRFVNEVPTFVNNGELRQEISEKLIEDRMYQIEKLEKLINIGCDAIEQMNKV